MSMDDTIVPLLYASTKGDACADVSVLMEMISYEL